MKKILILLSIFYAYQATAADFTDTLGAECGRILFALNEYDYPTMYDAINKRNKQLDSLEKCLELYKNNDGTTENINLRYYRAHSLYEIDMIACADEKDKAKKDTCKNTAQYHFNSNLAASSYELYNKYSYIYDSTDESKKETTSYQVAKEAKELTEKWFNDDVEKAKNMVEELNKQNDKENNKGFFTWFK